MNILVIIFGFAVVLLVYGGANYYIGRRLYRGLKYVVPAARGWLFALVYGLVALTLVLSFLPLPGAVRHGAAWIGAYWMGIFVYLFLSVLAADVLLLIGKWIRLIPSPIPAAVRFWSSLLAVLCAAGFTGYGIWHATQIYEVRYEVKLDDPVLARPLKVVLISDLHLGAIRSESRLEEVVARINRMEPDLVLISGDIFDDDYREIRHPARASELLRQIKATYGVYASLGNHDGGETFPQMLQFLENSNIRALLDEHVTVDGLVTVIGRLDSSPIGEYGGLERRAFADLLPGLEPDLPRIVLDHRPSHIDEYGNDVDLILSGHTHKGQIFPANLITNLLFVVDYGHYQKDPASPHVIVTSGVGTWGMPMRVATNCEIVEIVLQ
jgi:hypothetical protein